jgi:hypothetical protein
MKTDVRGLYSASFHLKWTEDWEGRHFVSGVRHALGVVSASAEKNRHRIGVAGGGDAESN